MIFVIGCLIGHYTTFKRTSINQENLDTMVNNDLDAMIELSGGYITNETTIQQLRDIYQTHPWKDFMKRIMLSYLNQMCK